MMSAWWLLLVCPACASLGLVVAALLWAAKDEKERKRP